MADKSEILRRLLLGLGAGASSVGEFLGQRAIRGEQREQALEDEARRIAQARELAARTNAIERGIQPNPTVPFGDSREAISIPEVGDTPNDPAPPQLLRELMGNVAPQIPSGDDSAVLEGLSNIQPEGTEGLENLAALFNRQEDARGGSVLDRFREFQMNPDAPGSLANSRLPATAGAVTAAREQAKLPRSLAMAATRFGVNPIGQDGAIRDEFEVANEMAVRIGEIEHRKNFQFDERLDTLRLMHDERLDSAEARAERATEIRVRTSPMRREALENLQYAKKKLEEIKTLRGLAANAETTFLGPGEQLGGFLGTLELTKMAAQVSDDPQVRRARDFISRVELFSGEIRHDLYGAALTSTELPRALSSLPSPENSMTTILDQLTAQEEFLTKTQTYFSNRLDEIDSLLPVVDRDKPVVSPDREAAIKRLRKNLGGN